MAETRAIARQWYRTVVELASDGAADLPSDRCAGDSQQNDDGQERNSAGREADKHAQGDADLRYHDRSNECPKRLALSLALVRLALGVSQLGNGHRATVDDQAGAQDLDAVGIPGHRRPRDPDLSC